MFRTNKFRTETLSYMPDVISVMETGKIGPSEIEDFRRIMSKRREETRNHWYNF